MGQKSYVQFYPEQAESEHVVTSYSSEFHFNNILSSTNWSLPNFRDEFSQMRGPFLLSSLF